MKKLINWKLFFILLVASVTTGLMALPYVLGLMPEHLPVSTFVLVVATLIQTTILFSVAIFVGLALAKRVGFGLPIVEGLLKGERVGGYFRSIIWLSIGLGVLASVLIILSSFLFGDLSLEFVEAGISVATWKAFLVSFYGGIAEEVLLRLFLMTLLVWITFKIKKTKDGKPTTAGIWLAIIVSSVLFGLGHLPLTASVTAITLAVVMRAILLNGIGGIIFGWLYWKKGLESAIIAHFTADICLHVLLPIIAVYFLS